MIESLVGGLLGGVLYVVARTWWEERQFNRYLGKRRKL